MAVLWASPAYYVARRTAIDRNKDGTRLTTDTILWREVDINFVATADFYGLAAATTIAVGDQYLIATARQIADIQAIILSGECSTFGASPADGVGW